VPIRHSVCVSTAAKWINLNRQASATRLLVTSQTFGKPFAVKLNGLMKCWRPHDKAAKVHSQHKLGRITSISEIFLRFHL